MRGRKHETAVTDLDEFFHVVGHATARTAQGKGGTNHRREAHFFLKSQGFIDVVSDTGARIFKADLSHGVLETLTVFGFVDGVGGGTDQFNVVLGQDTFLFQFECQIQGRLTAHRREDGIRAFFGDDALDHLGVQRFNVGDVSRARIGHDCSRVGVHQNNAVTLFTESLTSLSAGIVEFAGLTDDDRAGAKNHDGFDVCTFRHDFSLSKGLLKLNDLRRCLSLLNHFFGHRSVGGDDRAYHRTMIAQVTNQLARVNLGQADNAGVL